MDSLGKRLRYARERKRLKQTDVFKKVGINNKSLSRYENDGTEPDSETLRKLADLYEVSADWLLGTVKESASALPESDINQIVREVEAEYKIDLARNPIAHQAIRQSLDIIAQALKKSQ